MAARPPGRPPPFATLYGEEPIGLTELQLRLLNEADGVRTLGSLLDGLGIGTEDARRDALVLIDSGALDVLG